jgi:hypothetical protein
LARVGQGFYLYDTFTEISLCRASKPLFNFASLPENRAEMTYPQLVLITAVLPAGIPARHSVFAVSPKE